MGLILVMHIGDVLGWSGRLVRGAPMIIHQKSSARSGFYPNSLGFAAWNLAQRGYFVVAMTTGGHGEREGLRFDLAGIQRKGEIDLLEIRRTIKETADNIYDTAGT
jgi:hypothetical protein